MTLNQLRYFCTASRCHSITKAAQELYVTQPTISIAIRDLETEFDTILFDRNGNHLTLTSEGEQFYNRANYILQCCNQMQNEMADGKKQKLNLRIGVAPGPFAIMFPELLVKYEEHYPDSQIEIIEYDNGSACQKIAEGDLDLAIVNLNQHNIDKFEHCILLEDEMGLWMEADHHLADRGRLALTELAGERIVLGAVDSIQNRSFRSKCEAAGVHPQIVVQSCQILSHLEFVKRDHCLAFMPIGMLHWHPEFHAARLNPSVILKVGLIWKKGCFPTSEMKKFIDFASEFSYRGDYR